MKKFIFVLLILFMSISLVKADATFHLGDQVPNQYIEVLDSGRYHNGAPFILKRSDNVFVYCINPFETMSTTALYKSYKYNDPIFNLTDKKLNKLNIISYYGYGYQGHKDIKWYGITQFLIWKALGYEEVYFTDVYHGTKVEKYTSEISELEKLVSDYYKLPSFSNKKYEYNPNKSYEIVDTNNILSNYQIEASDIDASISNNKLIINTEDVGEYTIKFVRKSPVSRYYVLYNYKGAQSLLYPGEIDDITFTLSINVNGGSITINKYDSENKDRVEATLQGAKYGIYKNNNLINTITTNTDGTASINNLELGSYTIKEITSSKGYNKDTKTYNITISKTNNNIIIDSYSDVIKGNLIINKYYGSENDYKLDDDVVFEVYNNNILIKIISGQINEKLEYGTYLIKQVNGKRYYNLVDDIDVSILESKDYEYNFYTEKTDEIKAYEQLLNKREDALNKRQQELLELENKLKEENANLNNLKVEILKIQQELDKETQEFNKLKEVLNIKEENLIQKENELNKLKKELDLLKVKLSEKEKNINKLEYDMINKKIDLDKKEESNVLEVNVPNTYKKSYAKLLSIILIVIGSIFIFYSMKKTTNH